MQGDIEGIGQNKYEQKKLNDDEDLDYSFKSNKDIDDQERYLKCYVCGKTSAKKSHMQYHTETHIEGVLHSCNICSKTFSTRPTLQQHKSGIHSKLFSCDICEKSDMNRMEYRSHKRSAHKTLS